MEQWMLFLQERWYILLIGLVVLFLAIKLIKTVLKWIIVLALIAGIVIYAMNYKDEISELTASLGSGITASIKDQAIQAMLGEADEAKYKPNPDGSYTVTTKNLQVDVAPGSKDANITFMGQTFTLRIDDAVQSFIERAKEK